MTAYAATETPLDLAPLIEPQCDRDASIQERYEAWRDANAWVITTLEHLIEAWLAAGHHRVGMKQVWEVLRWQYGTTVGDRFKANNNYTSRAAREILARHPEWADVIETRELRTA